MAQDDKATELDLEKIEAFLKQDQPEGAKYLITLPIPYASSKELAASLVAGFNHVDSIVMNTLKEAMESEDGKIKELLSYSRLQWSIATKNDVHPSKLTTNFLKELLVKIDNENEVECARLGEVIMPQEEHDELVLKAKEFIQICSETGKVPGL